MECDALIKSIDGLASDLVFLPGREIDIPSAGKFMNSLEEIIGKTDPLQFAPLTQVATGLNQLLQTMILDSLQDKELGFNTLEKGIALMLEIAENFQRQGEYKGDPQPFIATIESLTGVAVTMDPQLEDSPKQIEPEAPAAKTQVQDLSLVNDFITEGLEYIDEIEVNILNLEQDPENADYINAIFRPFHSIKGVASFLNLENIRQLAHNLENLLDKARNGEIKVMPPLIDLILDGADVLKAMILQLKDEIENRPAKPLKVDLPALTARIKKAEKMTDDTPANALLGEILVNDGVITNEDLDEVLKTAQTAPERKIGKALIDEGKATPKQVSQALRAQVEKSAEASTLRVDTRKLDDLIDMVGELVITQSMIQQDLSQQVNANKNLMRDISQFFRITSSLQRTSMRLRMIPIKQTFQRMSRLVRDLAKNSGKSVNIEMVGEDTEIDRNMVDEIYNPLVHMVRNAVDHGLESPEDRVKAGKSEKGLIRLSAYHRGGNIVIEISDDGRGLNKDKILDKALKKGMVSNAEDLTNQEIYMLIMLPGLSTADKVTDVSGRGVGMDVVKKAVEKLRGKIEIDSRLGEGTKFVTSFPLTLAIIDGMMVKVGKEIYIIPTTAIRKTLRPSKGDYTHVINKGEMINVMGQLLPLLRLYELFGIEPEYKDPWEAIAVVVEGESQAQCLLVDNIIGKAEVVIKSLGEGLKHIKGVSGGAILGDGRIGLILDTEGLFDLNNGE